MSRSNIPSMITDSNQSCIAKMTGRRLQEVRVEKEGLFLSLPTEWSSYERKRIGAR